MKRFLLVLCYIVSLFISGCDQGDTPPKLQRDFDGVVTVENGDAQFEDFCLMAEISVCNLSQTEITLVSPHQLKGLSYIWDEGFEMVYLDLHCKTETNYLPEFSFAQGIYNVLKSLRKNNKATHSQDNNWLFEGKCESGEYKVLADDRGYIKNISIEEINLSVNFEYNE